MPDINVDKYINSLNKFDKKLEKEDKFISVDDLVKEYKLKKASIKIYIFARLIRSIVRNKNLSVWKEDIPLILAIHKLTSKRRINFRGIELAFYILKDKHKLVDLVDGYLESSEKCSDE